MKLNIVTAILHNTCNVNFQISYLLLTSAISSLFIPIFFPRKHFILNNEHGILFQLPCKTESNCIHKQLWEANQFQCSSDKGRCDNIVHKKCSFVRQKQAFPSVSFIAGMDCPVNKCLSTVEKLNIVTNKIKT